MTSSDDDVIQFGPNSTIQNIGFVVFLIGIFLMLNFSFQFLSLLSIGGLEAIFTIYVDIIIVSIPTIISLGVGYWMMQSGALALEFSKKSFSHRTFFNKQYYSWIELNDSFDFIVRSSQPQMKGRQGKETWDIEIRIYPKDKKMKTISVPNLSNKDDINLFFKELKRIINAVPVEKQEDKSLLVGKTQTIKFKIQRKSFKEIQKQKSKQKYNR